MPFLPPNQQRQSTDNYIKNNKVETRGPVDEATISFISELGRKFSEYSGDPFDSRYFFQRVIVLIQRITPFSAARPSRLKMKSTRSHSSLVLVFFPVFNPFDLYYLRYKIIIIIITNVFV